ncbi:MAG: AAA family ATPase [Ktedonobacteraceae bacterium]|nr:AAA family ATPase [Ktedonobacteraceae bacterium]
MVQLSSEVWAEAHEAVMDGFRLQLLEVYNWGTFNKRIWNISPSGGSALLTGANGSGKSTLADALLTLLVPFRKRTYNLASGPEKQHERDERSYIRGAWGKQKDLESNRSKDQYLRSNDTHSVLLAVFANSQLNQFVTLAQVLWLEENTVHKIFCIAQRPLNIDTHFRLQGSPKELRKHLKAQDIEVYDQFARYSQRFRQLLFLRSEKALDLFNQIVSIKEIGSLNAFVREHMLEKMDTQKRIGLLRDNFDNLTRAHDAIQLANRQIEILTPLMENAKKYHEQGERITEAERCANLLPFYIARCKLALLTQAITTAEKQLGRVEERQLSLDQTLGQLDQQIIDLQLAIRQDTIGQRIESLKLAIGKLEESKKEREREARKYERLARQLALPVPEQEHEFYSSRQQAVMLQQQINSSLQELQSKRDQYLHEKSKLEESCMQLEAELASLRVRTSQIPAGDIAIRRHMAEALGLPEASLPFVGELLRVRESEQQWEPAIERLLHNFGRQLLVAEEYYQQVSRYVDRTHLGGRLVYNRANTARSPRYVDRLEPDALYYKLEVKPDSPFTRWLESELIDGYNYRCCESLEEFQRTHRALTRNGQIKQGQVRHEKDDRSPLGDRRRYVLGWNNKEKIEAIAQDLARMQTNERRLSHLIEQVESRQKEARDRLHDLERLLDIEHFAAIDWRSLAGQIQEMRRQLHELESSSSHLGTLKRQLSQAEEDQRRYQRERDRALQESGALKALVDRYKKQEQDCQHYLDRVVLVQEETTLDRIQQELQDLQKREKGPGLSLETLDDVRERLRQLYTNRATSLRTQQNVLSQQIVNVMRDFLATSPALAQEMDASLEALEEYQRAYERIHHEDLPRHHRRFKDLLNEKVITDITSFQFTLTQQETTIREHIKHLNVSLSAIGYTDTTYIQLVCERTHDQQVHEFIQQLRACIPDVGQEKTPGASELSFQRISALLKQFEENPNWAQKVTNVCNWLDFSAAEIYRETGEQKNYYSDSSGKSGGQKAKLAYTILASAIAYQYGLIQEEQYERTFRFIVVDEAFSKSDERNARYAMELFRQLDLQVLIITPLDKIQIVEPYIAACHFVTNTEEENDSRVYNLTYPEYLEHKRRWQTQRSAV